jgi:hypothetical protein
VNKQEFIATVARTSDLSRRAAAKPVGAIVDLITEALRRATQLDHRQEASHRGRVWSGIRADRTVLLGHPFRARCLARATRLGVSDRTTIS